MREIHLFIRKIDNQEIVEISSWRGLLGRYSSYSNKYEGFLRHFWVLSIFLRFWIKKYMCKSIEPLHFVFVYSDLGTGILWKL